MARSREQKFVPQPKGSPGAYRHEGIYLEQNPEKKGSGEVLFSLLISPFP